MKPVVTEKGENGKLPLTEDAGRVQWEAEAAAKQVPARSRWTAHSAYEEDVGAYTEAPVLMVKSAVLMHKLVVLMRKRRSG